MVIAGQALCQYLVNSKARDTEVMDTGLLITSFLQTCCQYMHFKHYWRLFIHGLIFHGLYLQLYCTCNLKWASTNLWNGEQYQCERLLLAIEHIHKWRPIHYSLVLVLTTPTSLVCMDKTQKTHCFRARLVGLITTKTKE